MNKKNSGFKSNAEFRKALENLIHLVELRTMLRYYLERVQSWNKPSSENKTSYMDKFREAKIRLERMEKLSKLIRKAS